MPKFNKKFCIKALTTDQKVRGSNPFVRTEAKPQDSLTDLGLCDFWAAETRAGEPRTPTSIMESARV